MSLENEVHELAASLRACPPSSRPRLTALEKICLLTEGYDDLVDVGIVPAAPPAPPAPPAPTPAVTTDLQLEIVVADLQERATAGRLNDFGQSLWDQYRRNGRLSDRQIEAYRRGMDRSTQLRDVGTLPDVPKGRYAVESAEGELRFYRVHRTGNGRTFLHVQHGPSESDVRWNPATYRTILQSIVDAGIPEAMQRYGHEIGHCGNCGLRLTHRVSRELGIGPVCGGRMFDSDWSGMERDARATIIARGENPDEEVVS